MPDNTRGSRNFQLSRNVTFLIAVVILSLCGLAYVAEHYFGWQPPGFIRQAIDSVLNR